MKLRRDLTFILVFFLSVILVGQAEGNEENINISSIKYTNDLENGELITLVANGKDNLSLIHI